MSVTESPAIDPTIAPLVTRRDVLHRAADLIEEHGWCQDTYGLLGHGFCLIGALQQAHRDYGLGDIDHPEAALTYSPRSDLFLSGWNDAPGRTKAQVVARLREAAEASA